MQLKDVRGDGNCGLWATMVSYLEQVKTDESQFKKRYGALFGTISGWKRIFNFTNFNFHDNENVELVKLFRKRIVDYIEANLDTPRPENKADFRSMLLDSDINKNLSAQNNKELQIQSILEQMRKNGEITDSVEIEAICNMLNCNIIRTNENFEVANNELFEPDFVNTTNKIQIHYNNGHYKYFSNIIDNSINNNFDNFILASEQNNNFLVNARIILENQLPNKDIDDTNYNAIIDIFIDDLIKAPENKKIEVLKKSIFELSNQSNLLANPDLSFEASIKPFVNEPSKTSYQDTNILPLAIKAY